MAATVRINNLGEVTLDGVSAGQVVDVVMNHPEVRADLQAALADWDQRRETVLAEQTADQLALRDQAHAEAQRAALAELSAAYDAKLEALRQSLADQTAADQALTADMEGRHAQEVQSLREELATVTAERDALGTKPEAQAIQRQQRKQQLADVIKRAQAEQAELEKAEAATAAVAVDSATPAEGGGS